MLVGDDDGTRSRLRAVDPAASCASTVAVEAAVIRSGDPRSGPRGRRTSTASTGARARTSASGGVPPAAERRCRSCRGSRRTPATARPSRRTCDGRPTGASRSRRAARSRVARGSSTRRPGRVVATAGTGPVVGVLDSRVIAYDVCPGFPCGLLAVDPATAEIAADRRGRRAGRHRRTRARVPARRAPGRARHAHAAPDGDVAASDGYETGPAAVRPRGPGSTRPGLGVARDHRPAARPVDRSPPRPRLARHRARRGAAMNRARTARRARCGTSALLAAVGLVAGPGVAHDPDPILPGGLYAQNLGLTFGWASDGAPPAAMKDPIRAAADDANASRKSKAPTFDVRRPARPTTSTTARTCRAGSTASPACAATRPASTGSGSARTGHRFDWGTLRWCELSGGPDGCYQVRNVMLDELGHVLVLDHHENFGDDRDYDDAVVQTYSRTKPKAGWNAHAFGRCDVATLQQQYDVPSASAAVQHLPRRPDRALDRRPRGPR